MYLIRNGKRSRVRVSETVTASSSSDESPSAASRLPIAAAGAGVSVAAGLAVGGTSLLFLIGVASLSGLITWILASCIRSGRIWLDHPRAIMGIIIGLYWLAGGLEAEGNPSVLLSAEAVNWLGPALLEGTLFLAVFVLIAGRPQPQRDRSWRLGRLAPIGAFTIAALIAVLWSVRLWEIASGTYFNHAGNTLHVEAARVGLVAQLDVVLRFVPALATALAWARGHSRIAVLLGASEVAFIIGAGERLPVFWFLLALASFLSVVDRPLRTRTAVWAVIGLLLVVHPLVIGLRHVVSESGERPGIAEIFGDFLPSAAISIAGTLQTADAGATALALRSTASGYLAAVMDREDLGRGRRLEGETYLQSASALVPHILWPDKPVAGNPLDMCSAAFGLWQIDYIFTPITEAYCNFGTLGVLLLAAVYGLFGRLLARLFRAARRRSALFPALAPFLIPLICFETHDTMSELGPFRVAIPLILALLLVSREEGRTASVCNRRLGVASS